MSATDPTATTTGDETTTSKKFIDGVTVSKITYHPDNPRHLVGDVTDLAASIKDHGVLEPLIVVPPGVVEGADTTSRPYAVLIAGHRRLAAAKEAKVEKVPVIVRYDLDTRDKQVAAMVIENQHRADLSPVEEGEAYQLLLDITPEPTQAKVAKAVGMPRTRVSERVRLTKLNDTAKTAIHDGQITLTDALQLLSIEQRHPDLAEKVAIAAGTKDFAFELIRANRAAGTLDRYALVREHAEQLGTAVLTKAPGYGPDAPRKVWQGAHGVPTTDDDDRDPLLAAGSAHADCPGAAVYIPKDASAVYELGFYCTEYSDRHIPAQDDDAAGIERRAQEREAAEQQRLAAMSDEERAELERKEAEERAAREAKQERVDALEAARATRHAHFIDVINQAEPALAKWAMVDNCAAMNRDYGYIGSRFAQALLGFDPAGELDPEATRSELDKLPLAGLAIFAWLIDHEYADEDLVLQPWQDQLRPDTDYVAALTDKFGYQWSTVEIDEFGLDDHGRIPTDEDGEAAA